MFNFFSSKKVFATACVMYRNLWYYSESIYFERASYYNDYVRLSGRIGGRNYQVHVNCAEIAARVRDLKEHKDNDDLLLRVFAVACSCSDYGKFFKDFKHLANSLILNY